MAFPLSVSLASASSARAVLGHFAAALWRQEQLEQGEAGGRERRRGGWIDSAVAAVAFWGRSGEAVSSGAEHSSLSRYCASRLCSCLHRSGLDGPWDEFGNSSERYDKESTTPIQSSYLTTFGPEAACTLCISFSCLSQQNWRAPSRPRSSTLMGSRS